MKKMIGVSTTNEAVLDDRGIKSRILLSFRPECILVN